MAPVNVSSAVGGVAGVRAASPAGVTATACVLGGPCWLAARRSGGRGLAFAQWRARRLHRRQAAVARRLCHVGQCGCRAGEALAQAGSLAALGAYPKADTMSVVL